MITGLAAGRNLYSVEYLPLQSARAKKKGCVGKRTLPLRVNDVRPPHRLAKREAEPEQGHGEDDERYAFPDGRRRGVETRVGVQAGVQLVDVARRFESCARRGGRRGRSRRRRFLV